MSVEDRWHHKGTRERTKANGEKYSTSVLELVYVHFGSFLRAAVNGTSKLIAVHPFDGWEVEVPRRDKRVRDIWEQDRVNTVIPALSERERPIGLVSATCGHRQGEAFAVALEDQNRFRKEITIRHQVKRIGGKLVLAPPKGGKVRTVPLPDVTARAITEHVDTYGTVQMSCTCCPGKTWHIVFTTAKGGLTHRGASMEQVRDYMGHSSIKTASDTYGHLFEQAHERARSLMDDMFSAVVYPLRTAESR